MSYRLIIDTSTEHVLLGIAFNQTVLSSQVFLHSNQLSQLLLPTLERLLKETDLNLSQFDEIAVGIGPGSYTGTRVGVAVAKSLHFGLQKPTLRGFCSLLTHIPSINGQFVSTIRSKTGDFYLLRGARSDSSLTCFQSHLVNTDQLIKELNTVDLFIGRPLQELQTLFPMFPWTLPSPSIDPVLAYLKDVQNSSSNNLDLLYLHKP